MDIGSCESGKKNVNPVDLLSSTSVQKMPDDEPEEYLKSPEIPRHASIVVKREGSSKAKRTTFFSRNVTLLQMRQDRKEYYEARLLIEREKVDVQKAKVKLMEEKNMLFREGNDILRKKNCGLSSQEPV